MTAACLPDFASASGLMLFGLASTRSNQGRARSLDHQGRPFGGRGAQAAGVVEVVVGVDDVAHRLAGHELLRLGEHRQRAPVVQRAFHQDQVVFHLDRDAVMRAAGHVPDALGGLFGGHALGERLDQRRQFDPGRRIGLAPPSPARSSTGKPPWCWRMRVGNFTPPKSR